MQSRPHLIPQHGTTIADAFARGRERGNNFDQIRLVAALAVLLSHSFEITRGAGSFEPLTFLTGGQMGLGYAAILVFFCLSGFLLVHSAQRDAHPGRFLKNRALRLFPALVVVVAATSLFLGPILSTMGAGTYFASPAVWEYLLPLGPLGAYSGLPGVFENLPAAGKVNQPLWTLKYEIACYLALIGLAMLGLLRRWVCVGVLAALYCGAAATAEAEIGIGHYAFQLSALGRAFFAGAAFALFANHIPLNGRLAALSAGLLVCAALIGELNAAAPIFGGYLVLWLGLSRPVAQTALRSIGDLSYGIYIWGWPVQQLVETIAPSGAWAFNLALSAPMTIGLAWLSWRYVESPALRMKATRMASPGENISSMPIKMPQ